MEQLEIFGIIVIVVGIFLTAIKIRFIDNAIDRLKEEKSTVYHEHKENKIRLFDEDERAIWFTNQELFEALVLKLGLKPEKYPEEKFLTDEKIRT